MLWFEAQCPKCGDVVDRVDGEYGRHYAAEDLCTMSKREIVNASPEPSSAESVVE